MQEAIALSGIIVALAAAVALVRDAFELRDRYQRNRPRSQKRKQ